MPTVLPVLGGLEVVGGPAAAIADRANRLGGDVGEPAEGGGRGEEEAEVDGHGGARRETVVSGHGWPALMGGWELGREPNGLTDGWWFAVCSPASTSPNI